MNVRRLLVTASVAGLTTLAAPSMIALADVPTGSSGTGSSTIDTGSGATGSQNLTQTGSAGGSYRNCDDVRAAGKAPIFRGEPGYGPHLDPDGDGFACPTV
ncbi:excalibur calcium-binding domain-containing protein [Nocardia huaxiensis]|uniref:Excalibur calcium-binding domain-containing protein n=1 Tax=Nocardia huaxiensis TaxID=2755382 RepID=A0A7D6V8T4_9NOCA|nr:excalibur calcium-binding domain-containing protein [Nocardia huaxiensis]QLY30441.1 excalibur calcium-binding domain-containing protein [Nocardia huaxiensis]UFS95960.1 excalibur calcium-binding domain-containing protein [Nocardia huaxiensis]